MLPEMALTTGLCHIYVRIREEHCIHLIARQELFAAETNNMAWWKDLRQVRKMETCSSLACAPMDIKSNVSRYR